MSNLPYLSKTIERVVAARLSAHMSECNLCVPNQSAYKPNHSVETALVCVQNDILRAIDNQNIVIMLLLDLSAAFDTVDHDVMLHRLSHDVGVGQTALKWFKSYLSDRVQAVHINGSTCQTALNWFKSYMSDRVQAIHINGSASPARPLRVGFLKVPYLVCSCFLSMQHHYQKSFGTTT